MGNRGTLFDSAIGDRPFNMPLTNNYAATTNPGVSNDSTQGYSVGSQWINTATGTAYLCMSASAGAAVWAIDANTANLGVAPAPVTRSTAVTLSAADLQSGIILSAPAAAINLQLPLATAMDTALPGSVANNSLDFFIVNTTSTGADTDTITTNTGWTLVGSMVVTPTANGGTSAHFRAIKTGAGAWTLYRLS